MARPCSVGLLVAGFVLFHALGPVCSKPQEPDLEILEPARGSQITLFAGEHAPLKLAIEFLTVNAADCGAYKLNIRLPDDRTSVVNPCVCVDTFEVCILTVMQPDIPLGPFPNYRPSELRNVTIVVDITDPADNVLARAHTWIEVVGTGEQSNCRCLYSSCGCVLRYADLQLHRTLRCSAAGCDLAAAA